MRASGTTPPPLTPAPLPAAGRGDRKQRNFKVSKLGFWLFLGDEELHVSFAEFPWFKKATIEQLTDVQRPTRNHLYWPQLDADLSVDSIRNPAAFPLVAKMSP